MPLFYVKRTESKYTFIKTGVLSSVAENVLARPVEEHLAKLTISNAGDCDSSENLDDQQAPSEPRLL